MRSLTLQDGNWSQWKFGDTDAVMTFDARTDGNVPDFADSVLTFHLALATNDKNKPGDYEASAPGYVDTTGKLAQLHTSDLTSLEPATYAVELWLTDKATQKVSVYPSDGFVFFTIDENTMHVSDIANISTKTIQAVYDELLQKINAFKTGVPGKDGQTPKLKAGTVTKLDPSVQPTYTLTPDATDPNTYVIDFGIPAGQQGQPGKDGKSAIQPIFNIAKTDTLQPGASATVSVQASTDLSNFDFTFGIPTGPTGPAGKDFHLAKTYKSIKEMNDGKGDGLVTGDYVMISSDVNDEDNGKLYFFDGTAFAFKADLSGPQGATGVAPEFSSIKAKRLAADADPTATISKAENGTYVAEFGIPSAVNDTEKQTITDLQKTVKELSDQVKTLTAAQKSDQPAKSDTPASSASSAGSTTPVAPTSSASASSAQPAASTAG
jgi:hypothetical protein